MVAFFYNLTSNFYSNKSECVPVRTSSKSMISSRLDHTFKKFRYTWKTHPFSLLQFLFIVLGFHGWAYCFEKQFFHLAS